MNTTHQLSLQAVIRYAVLLYRNSFRKLFTVALFAAILSQLLVMQIAPEMIDPKALSISPLAVVILVASAVIFAISCAALQYLLFAQHRRVPLLPQNSVLLAIKHGLPILGNCLLFSVFVTFGLMLYVLPGLLIATLLLIFLPLTLFEDLRGPMALVNSARWIRPFFWSALAMLLLCLATTSIIPTSIILAVAYLLPQSALPLALERTLDILFSALTLPLANCLVFSFYQALKAFHQRPNQPESAK